MESRKIFTEEEHNSKIVILVFSLMFFLGLALWVVFTPVIYGSVIFWLGAILMGVPGYLAGEGLGSFGLGSNFIKNISRTGRIIFGVIWVLFCVSIYSLVLGGLSVLVGK